MAALSYADWLSLSLKRTPYVFIIIKMSIDSKTPSYSTMCSYSDLDNFVDATRYVSWACCRCGRESCLGCICSLPPA